MAPYDFSASRLFVAAPLHAGATIDLTAAQVNYLCKVLRLADGTNVLAFNGADGEWRCALRRGRRSAALEAVDLARGQSVAADLEYMFAPLKQARLDYMVQKAVEMGVSRLAPVLTQHGQVGRVSEHRLHANAVEAAEQCGILTLPTFAPLVPLAQRLDTWPAGRPLVFCDEDAPAAADAIAALRAAPTDRGVSLLIGPEGGFSEPERQRILSVPSAIRLSLGPRILRADTAAVAALALIGAACGERLR